MTKEEFIKYLHENRKANFESEPDVDFPPPDDLDDELAWRLYQVFPSDWNEEDRYAGMTVLTCHLTFYSLALLKKDVSLYDGANYLYQNLIEDFGYTVGKKYLYRFYETVKIFSENEE